MTIVISYCLAIFHLKAISGFQQAHQGFVGFFIRKQGGESLVHHQGFQAQFQMALCLQAAKAIAEAAAA